MSLSLQWKMMQIDRLHQRLLQAVKKEVLQFRKDPELKRYESVWERGFKSGWKASNRIELVRSLNQSRVVLLGDFHGYEQSQRTHLRLLRRMVVSEAVTLMLECFSPDHDKDLLAWSGDEISTSDLLKRVKWKTQWGFSWESYRPLLELAKAEGWRIRGLGPLSGRLQDRDRQAASRVANASKEGKVVVVVGDFHLHSEALPKILKKISGLEALTIHQNSEAFLGKWPGRTHVLKKGESQYCLLNSAPWIKWMSHLVFGVSSESQPDPEPFQDFLETIQAQWQQELFPKSQLDWNFFFWTNPPKFVRGSKRITKNFVREGVGFVWFPEKCVWVARPSLNLGIHLVAQSLWMAGLGRQIRNFEELLLSEAFAFCLSKTLNPYRPARPLLDLARESSGSAFAHAAYLKCKMFAKSPKKSMKATRLTSSDFFAARRLGAILGEVWWRQVRNRTPQSIARNFGPGLARSKQQQFLLKLWQRAQRVPLQTKGERL